MTGEDGQALLSLASPGKLETFTPSLSRDRSTSVHDYRIADRFLNKSSVHLPNIDIDCDLEKFHDG